MNITSEEIIIELEKMLPSSDGLWNQRIQELVARLKNNNYVLDNMMNSDSLIYELRSIGFHDIANRLIGRGNYGRY